MLNRLIFSIFTILFAWTSAFADEKVTFEVHSKMIVAAGEAFKVEFALNAEPEKNSFTPPDFSDFDILAGPATSTGHSVQFINGSMSKSVSYTITYVLLPRSSGTFTIGSAAIKSDGKRYATNPTQIEVTESGQTQSQPSQGARGNDRQSMETQAEGQIGSEDLLLRLNLSRSSVYTGEPLLASLKLYNRVNLADYSLQKMPSFNGFWSQQLESDSRPHRETYNGKVYEVYTLIEYLLYPQQSGKLTIDPVELTAVVQVVVQNNSNFDPFFGGGREIYNVRRNLSTPRITVNVKELPAGAPSSFTGAVGRFTMEGAPSATELSANSAATYTLKISGAGNLAFIQAPKLNLPSSFEQYQVKTVEQLRSTGSGTTGSRTFEYPFIARAEGDYTIQPVEFTYFDPERTGYVTLTSAACTLAVAPDANGGSAPQVISGLSKENVKMLGNDIRFIKLGDASLEEAAEPTVFSISYFVLLFAMAVAALTVYNTVLQRRRENGNVAFVRGKRASKVAIQRFRTAEKFKKADNRHAFYEEMLKAMWGYIGDKFNIPVADLTKDYVREELHKHGITAETAQQFISVISKCDEAQYSPVADTGMDEVYAEGIEIVSQLESMIKK